MDIGTIKEIGDRKIDVPALTPAREPAPAAPQTAPEPEKEDA
jgi:hypothetical protein